MEGPIIGVICFFGMLSIVFFFKIYSHVLFLERSVGRIARHLGVDVLTPGVLSERVKEAANDPARKIEAIKLFREETGASLAEAKAAVEHYIRTAKS